MLLVVLCFSACAGTRKDWVITGGSQANGIVELSYQYREFEVPHTNEAQAHVVANLGCHEWGYSNSRPFGRPIKNCNQHGGFLEDCASWTVSRQYISALVPGPIDETRFLAWASVRRSPETASAHLPGIETKADIGRRSKPPTMHTD
jgi:YecR-like lipoprotein